MRIAKARLGGTAFAVASVVALAAVPPASAGTTEISSVPVQARLAKITAASAPAKKISKQAYLDGAARAGVTLSQSAKANVAAGTACWRWDAWRLGENVFGADLWKSHHRVNWCGDGSWICVHAYTERWGKHCGLAGRTRD